MSYKALNDGIRHRSLPAFLHAAGVLGGILVTFAIDKRALPRLSEAHRPETAFGSLGPWAKRSFQKLSRVGHLGAIVIEGVRADGQDLLWLTDEDEIAPNATKHAEATRLIGHLLNSYVTGDMGHFHFGTTASDPGDLLIEDLAAIPDLAAGAISDVLTAVAPNPESSRVVQLFVPSGGTRGGLPTKVHDISAWMGRTAGGLAKVTVVVDEGPGGCAARRLTLAPPLQDS